MGALRKEFLLLASLAGAFGCTIAFAVVRSTCRPSSYDPLTEIEKPYYRPRPVLVGKFPLLKQVEANFVTSVNLDGIGRVDLLPRERKEQCLVFRIPAHLGVTPLSANARVEGRPAAPLPIEPTSHKDIGCVRIPPSITASNRPFEVELFLGLNRMQRWNISRSDR